MATKYWRGGAAGVAQITTVTFSAYTSGQTYSVIINGKTLSYVAAASTITDVVNGLLAAWQATTEPEFAEATPSNSSGLRLVGVTLGKPFTVTASATTGSATVTTSTAATGPNHFNQANNWVGGVVPAGSDLIVFENGSIDCLYEIESATNYGNMTIDSTYTGSIGLPATNSGGYREYRPRFLKLGDGTTGYALTIGLGSGRQPTRVLIDANQGDITASIYGSGANSGTELPIVIKNHGSASTLDLYGGQVQIDADSTGALSATRVTPNPNTQGAPAKLVCGPLVACGAVVVSGGDVEIRGTTTSLVASLSAVVKFVLAATCPTLTVSSGARVLWSSTAGITTKLFAQSRGTIDFSLNGAAKTVAATDVYADAQILDPLGVITWTGGMALKGCRVDQVTIDVGVGRTLSIS